MKFIKENYARFFGETPDKSSYGGPIDLVRKLVELLPSNSTVLDLGAGDGRHAIYLASKGFKVKAVDASEAGLRKLEQLAAQQNAHVETAVVDLNTWSIDADYDAIVATVIFQHLHTEPALRLLHEIKSRTKTHGINVLTIFIKTGDRYELDKEEDPEAFYIDDGWLKEFYKDWNILENDTFTSPLIGKRKPDGTPMQSTTERILAKKMMNLSPQR